MTHNVQFGISGMGFCYSSNVRHPQLCIYAKMRDFEHPHTNGGFETFVTVIHFVMELSNTYLFICSGC